MRAILKLFVIAVFLPLLLPLGLIAVMLDPFLEIIVEEKNNDNSK